MCEVAVGIARVSTKGQEEEGYSLDSQVKLMHAYADNHELNVVKVYKIAESASKAEQRRIFRKAMTLIEERGIKNLVVEKVDRHARNFHDAVETHDWLLADEQRKIHFIKDGIVLHKNSRSQEWLNWGIRVVMAKNYIDNLREEAMKGWTEKLAQGWMPGVPPPGYVNITRDGKRVQVPNPETWRIVHEMFELYLSPGQSAKTIAKEMALRGMRTRKGRPYAVSKVDKMLTNPFYVGIIQWNGKEYPGKHETFISPELWQCVQEKKHGKRPTVLKKHNPLFKNLITCSTCGGVVTWQLQKGRYYGSCQRLRNECKGRKTLREDRLEELIEGMLAKLICPAPEVIEWVTEELRKRRETTSQTRTDSLKALDVQIERLQRMDSVLYDDKLAGEITRDVYQLKHEAFMSQLRELEDKRDVLVKGNENDLEQRLALLKLSQRAAELYRTRSIEQKRVIITKLFSRITYNDSSVSVIYSKFAEVIANKSLETGAILGR